MGAAVTIEVEDSHAGHTGCIYKKVRGQGSREIQGQSAHSSSGNPHTRPASLSDTHHTGSSPGSLYTGKRTEGFCLRLHFLLVVTKLA